MPIARPRLMVEVGYDDKAAQAQGQRDALRHGEKLAQIASTAAVKEVSAVSLIKAKGTATLAQKLLAQNELFWNKSRLQQERALQRMQAGHTTWSQKITKQLEGIGFAVKAMAVMYAVNFLKNILQTSLRYTASLVDQAEAIGLTVSQFGSLEEAAKQSETSIEKVVIIINRLLTAAQSPTDKQATVLSRLGINAEGMDRIQIFDALLKKVYAGIAKYSDVAALVGAKAANAFMLLAGKIDSVADAEVRFKTAITDAEAKRIDDAIDKMSGYWHTLYLWISRATVAVVEFDAGIDKRAKEAHYKYFPEQRPAQPFVGPMPLTGAAPTAANAAQVAAQLAYDAEQQQATLDAAQAATDKLTEAFDKLISSEREDTAQKKYNTTALLALIAGTKTYSAEWERYLGILKQVNAEEEKKFRWTPYNKPSYKESKEGVSTPDYSGYVFPSGQQAGITAAIQGFDAMIAGVQTLAEKNALIAHIQAQIRGGVLDPEQLAAAKAKLEKLTGAQARFNALLSAAEKFTLSFTGLLTVGYDNELVALDAVSAREAQRWADRSAAMQAAGMENSSMYRNEQREFEASAKKRAATQKKLQGKAWDVEHNARYVGTTMETAQAIMAQLRTGGTLGWILAAMAAAEGVVQLATIASQKNPYQGMALGGWIQGDGSRRDNVPFMGMSGEYVVPRETARRNAEALEFMGAGGTARPSQVIHVHIGNVIGTDQWVTDNLIPTFKKLQRNGHIILN